MKSDGNKAANIGPLLAGLALVFLTVNAWAFPVPEKLQYELSVGNIPVGSLSLEAIDAGASIKLSSSMYTVSWVSLFYEVNDHAESTLKRSRQSGMSKNFPYLPLVSLVRLHEGPHAIDTVSIFDHNKKTLSCSDFLENSKSSLRFENATLDLLSALYYLRTVSLIPGKSVILNIYHNKTIRTLAFIIAGRETIQVGRRSYATVVARADTYFDGWGVINYPGDVIIWFTDDDLRIPVLIEKKLPFMAERALPEFAREKIPDFFQKKLSSGSIKASLMQAGEE